MTEKEKISDIRQVMADLSALHHTIHKNDPNPQTELERQAEVVLESFKRILLNLIFEECRSDTIELSLFYFWHYTFAKNAGLEEKGEKFSIEHILPIAVKLIRDISETITDKEPSAEMIELGEMVTLLKQKFHGSDKKPKSQKEIVDNTKKVNSSLVELINILIHHGIHPILMQNVMLYYWFRISTINANVDEAFFQKIERNWPEVVEAFNLSYLKVIRE